MIICSTKFLSAKFGHSDYIILTFKAEFVCPTCSDFITSSYLNAPEALKLCTNGFLCIIMTFTVSIVTNIHTWPDPSFDAIQHTLGSKQFFDDGNSYLKHTTELYWSCSAFEMIICNTKFLCTKFGHSDYIILTFKAEFVCPACSDFITSSYLNAPEALKLCTNGFLCIIMTFTVSIVTNIHTWPDPSFDAIQHTLGSKPFFDDGNSYLKHTTF